MLDGGRSTKIDRRASWFRMEPVHGVHGGKSGFVSQKAVSIYTSLFLNTILDRTTVDTVDTMRSLENHSGPTVDKTVDTVDKYSDRR